MKGIVVFDSVFGNTREVAEAIGEQIRDDGHEVELIYLRESQGKAITGDFIFIGSPTRIGRMTGRTKRYIKKLSPDQWKGKPVVAFDTIMPLPKDEAEKKKAAKWIEYGAAPRIHDYLKENGFDVRSPVLRVEVKDIKGPLSKGAIEKAKKYTHENLK